MTPLLIGLCLIIAGIGLLSILYTLKCFTSKISIMSLIIYIIVFALLISGSFMVIIHYPELIVM